MLRVLVSGVGLMFPILFDFGPVVIRTHDFFVLLGVVVAVVVLWVRGRTQPGDPRLTVLVAGGLFSGAVFAKFGTGWQYVVRADDATLAGLWVHGGQSVLGGLAGAYLGIVLTKKLIGYRGSTGDWFAPAVAGGLAVGRVGCFLTEQIGTPTTLPWGISISEATTATMLYCPSCAVGLPMHPSFLYEILFHFGAFLILMRTSGKLGRPGDSFKLYLLAYAVFRFGVEYVRDNPEFAFGLSGSQVFLVSTLPIGLALYLRRRRQMTGVAGGVPA